MNKKYSYISNIRYGWAERKLSSNRVYYSFILSVSIIVDWPEQRDNPPPFRSVFERLAGEEDLEDFRNREAEETAFILWKLMDGPTMIDIRRIEGRIATILHNVSSRRNRLSGREFKRRWETPSGEIFLPWRALLPRDSRYYYCTSSTLQGFFYVPAGVCVIISAVISFCARASACVGAC